MAVSLNGNKTFYHEAQLAQQQTNYHFQIADREAIKQSYARHAFMLARNLFKAKV